jgi:hypothetical protein
MKIYLCPFRNVRYSEWFVAMITDILYTNPEGISSEDRNCPLML